MSVVTVYPSKCNSKCNLLLNNRFNKTKWQRTTNKCQCSIGVLFMILMTYLLCVEEYSYVGLRIMAGERATHKHLFFALNWTFNVALNKNTIYPNIKLYVWILYARRYLDVRENTIIFPNQKSLFKRDPDQTLS